MLSALKSKGIKAKVLDSEVVSDDSTRYTITAEGPEDLSAQLIASLSKQDDCTLLSLAPHQPNLEEIFLAATKRSWEETIDKSRSKKKESEAQPAASK